MSRLSEFTLLNHYLAGECEEESEESENQVAQELELFVAESSAYLLDKKKKTQMKGVKILSALAQTGKDALCHPMCSH